MLKIIADKILPPSIHRKAKRWNLNRQRQKAARFPKLSEESFRNLLTDDCGLKRGSVVFIHSSASKLNINFPASRIIPLLLNIVGEEGTLLFPCTHITGRAQEHLQSPDFCFDAQKSPSKMGLLSEYARRHKGSVRSLHPTNSVVAIGRHAKEFTCEHTESVYPCDEKSPYYKICAYDGLILGLGVSSENLTFVHCVEDIIKKQFPVKTRMDKIFEAPVIDLEGNQTKVKTLAAHPDIAYRNVPRFMQSCIAPEIGGDFTRNGSQFFTFKAKPLFEAMKECAAQNKTIYNLGLIKMINFLRFNKNGGH